MKKGIVDTLNDEETVFLYPTREHKESLRRLNDFWELDKLDEDGELSDLEIALLPIDELCDRAEVEFGEGTAAWIQSTGWESDRVVDRSFVSQRVPIGRVSMFLSITAACAASIALIVFALGWPLDKRLHEASISTVNLRQFVESAPSKFDIRPPLEELQAPRYSTVQPYSGFSLEVVVGRVAQATPEASPRYAVPFVVRPVPRPKHKPTEAIAIEPEIVGGNETDMDLFKPLPHAGSVAHASSILETHHAGDHSSKVRNSPEATSFLAFIITPLAPTFSQAALYAGLNETQSAIVLAKLREIPDFDEYGLQTGDRIEVGVVSDQDADIVVNFERRWASVAPSTAPKFCIRTQKDRLMADVDAGPCASTEVRPTKMQKTSSRIPFLRSLWP